MAIYSEIHPLQSVLLHQPGKALARLTHENCHDFLFDDVICPSAAKEEHAVFVASLEQEGVEVHTLINLLSETLDNDEARAWLLPKVIYRAQHESKLAEDLSTRLCQLDSTELSEYLLGGMTYEELGQSSGSLTERTLKAHDFVLNPLPNQLFMRDTSCWLGEGVSINPMHEKVRRRESYHLGAIYRFHPDFIHLKFPIWYDGSIDEQKQPSIEGGDVLVLNKQNLLVGLSLRTRAQAIEALAHRLFGHSGFQQITVIELPQARALMHLDTVMTQVSDHQFCADPAILKSRCWSLTQANDELKTAQVKDLSTHLAQLLNVTEVKFIYPTADHFETKREQWTDGHNLLTIAPSKVIAYEHNHLNNEALEKAGIDVLTFKGPELSRGRGGPRCMSCPLSRLEG